MKYEKRAAIFIHALLNSNSTPIQVCYNIVVHELIHLIIPKRNINGELVMHPDEFWECERKLTPEQIKADLWLKWNFPDCIKEDKHFGGTIVLRTWKKYVGTDCYSWEQCWGKG